MSTAKGCFFIKQLGVGWCELALNCRTHGALFSPSQYAYELERAGRAVWDVRAWQVSLYSQMLASEHASGVPTIGSWDPRLSYAHLRPLIGSNGRVCSSVCSLGSEIVQFDNDTTVPCSAALSTLCAWTALRALHRSNRLLRYGFAAWHVTI